MATIFLDSIKDPDGWQELIHELGLTDKQAERFFEFGEYADLELEVEWTGSKLLITGGQIRRRLNPDGN